MATSAGFYFSHNKQMKKQFESLKLPNYLSGVLGTANVLGVAALLAPRQTLLKEWAYSGFTFTFLGAAAVHLATKQNKAAVAPLMSLAVLAASYLTRPFDRKLAKATQI